MRLGRKERGRTHPLRAGRGKVRRQHKKNSTAQKRDGGRRLRGLLHKKQPSKREPSGSAGCTRGLGSLHGVIKKIKERTAEGDSNYNRQIIIVLIKGR